jgi:hypothetical protein
MPAWRCAVNPRHTVNSSSEQTDRRACRSTGDCDCETAIPCTMRSTGHSFRQGQSHSDECRLAEGAWGPAPIPARRLPAADRLPGRDPGCHELPEPNPTVCILQMACHAVLIQNFTMSGPVRCDAWAHHWHGPCPVCLSVCLSVTICAPRSFVSVHHLRHCGVVCVWGPQRPACGAVQVGLLQDNRDR